MRTCKKCNTEFPIWMVIEGKTRNLKNRKFCVDCSPFGKGNRKQLHLSETQKDETLTCPFCSKDYVYDGRKQKSRKSCNACDKKQRSLRIKQKCVDYKGGKCIVCGYNACLRALEFHHVDPTTKSFTFGYKSISNWDILKAELDKCVLLCANHHAEVEAGIINVLDYMNN